MKKLAIGLGVLLLALGGVTMARDAQSPDKLPKCSGSFCQAAGCSPDVLCVRGAHVVTCAVVCGGK